MLSSARQNTPSSRPGTHLAPSEHCSSDVTCKNAALQMSALQQSELLRRKSDPQSTSPRQESTSCTKFRSSSFDSAGRKNSSCSSRSHAGTVTTTAASSTTLCVEPLAPANVEVQFSQLTIDQGHPPSVLKSSLQRQPSPFPPALQRRLHRLEAKAVRLAGSLTKEPPVTAPVLEAAGDEPGNPAQRQTEKHDNRCRHRSKLIAIRDRQRRNRQRKKKLQQQRQQVRLLNLANHGAASQHHSHHHNHHHSGHISAVPHHPKQPFLPCLTAIPECLPHEEQEEEKAGGGGCGKSWL